MLWSAQWDISWWKRVHVCAALAKPGHAVCNALREGGGIIAAPGHAVCDALWEGYYS